VSDFKTILRLLGQGETLSANQAAAAFAIIMDGGATPAQLGAFLMALHLRGETVEEVTGAVRTMRAKATPVAAPGAAIDIVGTGGDGAHTLNVSTAAALVVAGCGVPVAKHGNRAVSSRCGAADVLAALGVRIDLEPAAAERVLHEAGICFLLAPRYHAAMRHVAGPRGELGLRTIFNVLGPLANPAQVTRQLTGAFDARWVEPMAEVLRNVGVERAWVVHGRDGLDELTLTGPSLVADLDQGRIRVFEVTPEDAGLPRAGLEALRGGTADVNAAAIVRLLDGEECAFRHSVLLNAAAALMIAGKAGSLRDGAALAARAIDDGAARSVLARFVAASQAA
jgi:anthranilate phosphoribosyltransferase